MGVCLTRVFIASDRRLVTLKLCIEMAQCSIFLTIGQWPTMNVGRMSLVAVRLHAVDLGGVFIVTIVI